MEKLLQITYLYDFYGQLLTEKQNKTVKKYYLEDLSLSEIASQDDVSRQSIHDMVKQAEKKLIFYEKKLGLVKRFKEQEKELESIIFKIQKIQDRIDDPEADYIISDVIKKMQKIVND